MDKENVLYPYSTILFDNLANEVLIYTAAYMNLENIMVSGRSQSQKVTCYMIPFM